MDDHLPVRYLDNFTIFDERTGEIIGLDEVEENDTVPYFEGAIHAKIVDPEAEEEPAPQLLRSSTILSVWQSEEVEPSDVFTDLE